MRVRALLIVNPRATTTTKPVREVIVRTLAAKAEIKVVETRHRGDAREIACGAAAAGWDALLVLSGDGTINEVVNGLMDKESCPAEQVPALGALPGGNANVFTRDLGVPPDPLAAVEVLAARLGGGTTPARRARLGRGPVLHLQRRPGLGRRGHPRGGAPAGPGPRGVQPPVHADRAAGVLPAHRPAAPQPERGGRGGPPDRAGGPGPAGQHLAVVLRRPAPDEPDPAGIVRQGAGCIPAAAVAYYFHT